MKKSTSRLLALLMSTMMLVTMIAPATASAAYESDYASKAEALQAGLDLNERIAEEGMILMKNENGALPLAKGAKVTMLGYAGYNPNAGASANGGDASAGAAIAQATVISSLNDAGFELNPAVSETYADVVAQTGAASDADMKAAYAAVGSYWTDSFAEYGDAALVVLRSGSEGLTHRLQFDATQMALVDYAAEHFEKVIVLINNVSVMEMKALQDNDKIDAILNIGEGGDNGFAAVGRLLCGEVSPSGRTVDTWAVDLTKSPSYANFNVMTDVNAHSVDGAGTATGYTQFVVDGQPVNTWEVGYEEGIYVGYRYYETRAYEEAKAGNEGWWAENVVYPFGYGLSYTTFDWEVTPATAAGSTITKADTLVFDVKVTNTGAVAGKDVVQLYYTAPYGVEATGNETVIEKAHVVLTDFAKTDVLQPGESQTVQVAVDVKDMASYDNVTDKTYVLDAGTYGLKIAQNAHFGMGANDTEITYTVAEKALCNESVGGAEVTNVLDDVTDGFAAEGYTQLSRADFEGTMPDAYTETKEISAEEYASYAYDNDAFNAYYDAEAIGTVTVADAADRTGDTYSIVLSDLIGAPADDPRYDELADQLTLDEMIELVNYGGFNSRAVDYIGKPFSRDTDGPKGWTGNFTDTNDRFNYFASEPMVAGTFNKALLYEMGQIIGDQGLWGNSTIASGTVYSYTGWYGPGMNLHRSPFDSRATEYYSEDPALTGIMAANLSQGALSKGCYVTLKHFAFHNDGGGSSTYRMGPVGPGTGSDGLAAWMTEQTAREIYLKGYQIAVEDGGANFMMGSFTRIGKTWCGGSYAINQQITRDEWGFDGAIVTDIAIYNSCNAYQLIKASSDMMLDASVYGLNFGTFLDKDTILAMDDADRNITLYCLKNTAKHILYMVANSNAMQIPAGAKVVYTGTTVVDDEDVAIKLENAKAGEAYTSVALDSAKLNTYYAYSDISYTVDGLPEGLTFEGGVITGTPAAAGEYTVTVTAEAEGYAPASVAYPLVVE